MNERLAEQVRRLYEEAWQGKGKWETSLAAAEVLLREHLETEPECIEALTSLGAVLSDLGRHDAAIAVLRRAVAHEPADANAYFNLAAAMMNVTKQRRNAMRWFRKADAHDQSPSTLRAYFDPHGH